MSAELPVVGLDVLRRLVGEAEALESTERALRLLGERRAIQPPPMGFELAGAAGEVHVKAAGVKAGDYFSVKVATAFEADGSTHGSGLIVLFDARSGVPRAVLFDQAYLTNLRTAAAGALAVRHLAPRSFDTLLVVGTGAQARYQLRAISRVASWGSTLAWGRHPQRLARFRDEMSEVAPARLNTAGDLERAVRAADVIVTVTSSRSPLIQGPWVRPTATVVAVGSDAPAKRELAVDLVARADKLVVDHLGQCLELGELHHAVAADAVRPTDVYAELGEVVAGAMAGREGDELIVCDLTGVGVLDTAIAELAWERYLAQGPWPTGRAL